MMSTRGRAKLRQGFIGKDNQLVNKPIAPRYEYKRVNVDTQSLHEVNTDDDDVSLIPAGTSAAAIARNKPGPKPKPKAVANANLNEMLLSIKNDTSATRKDILSTRSELKMDIKKLAARTDTRIDALDSQLAKANGDIKTIFAKLKDVEKKSHTTMGNVELQKQMQLRNNITIFNVPPTEGENLYDIICAILEILGLQKLQLNELVGAKRVSSSRSHLIIATLRDYETKLAIMKNKAARKVHVSNIYDIGDGAQDRQIFINNHMTPFYSNLSFHGRNAISNGQIHSCWVSSSGFLVRLNADSAPVAIDNAQHLESFLKDNGRTAHRKRYRSPVTVTDPSPTANRASKINKEAGIVNTSNKMGDAMKEIGDAAKRLSISPLKETTATMNESEQGNMET